MLISQSSPPMREKVPNFGFIMHAGTTVSKITSFAPSSAFLSYKQNWVKTFKKSNWYGVKFCQSLWGERYEGPERVRKQNCATLTNFVKVVGGYFSGDSSSSERTPRLWESFDTFLPFNLCRQHQLLQLSFLRRLITLLF